MELVNLDSGFQPVTTVENYDSLVWAERYAEPGDFELTSNDVSTIRDALPLDSYVSLRESTVVMKVEDHKIRKPSRQAPVITVTGRTFETVLERRASVKTPLPAPGGREAWSITAGRESDAAYKLMRSVLGDTPRFMNNVEVLPEIAPAVSPLDAILEINLILPDDYIPSAPAWSSTVSYEIFDLVFYEDLFWRAVDANLNQTPSVSSAFWIALSYEIPPNNLYTAVMDLIHVNHRGLKSVRPLATGVKVGIEIYNGADLTEDVVFDARFDQFDETTYLLSRRGSKNVAYVYGASGSHTVLKNTAEEPSGMERRVLLVDGAEGEEETRTARGLAELYKYNATALFDGQIAQQIARDYNVRYHLGDIIKLTGEYDLSQNVRVAEFIRSSDSSGEKAYPTFQAIE